MRWDVVLREAVKSARAAWIPSLLVLLVCAAATSSVMVTAGRSAATASTLASQLTQESSRALSIVDSNNKGVISPAAVATIATTTTAARTLALTTPVDAWNGAIGSGGTRLPLWQVDGNLLSAGTLLRGRLPRVHEAVITPTAQRSLGLAAPTGYVTTTDGTQFAIVGLIQPTSPYDDLGQGILAAWTPGTPLRELRLVVTSIENAQATQDAVLAIVAPPSLSTVEINSPVAAAASAQSLIAAFAAYGRQLVMSALAAGFLLVALVVLADVLMRRKDLGRRRTLGISRADLIMLVTARTGIAAGIGSVVGAAASYLFLLARWHSMVPISFAAGAVILEILATLAAAVLPAAFAAYRDPVSVMRSP